MPYSEQDEVGYELTELHERQQSEAEPQPEHSAKIRYVLYVLRKHNQQNV